MDPAPPVANPNYAGVGNARKVVKHTILSNPKETAILIAILVIVIIVLSAYLLKCQSAAKAAKEGAQLSRGGHSAGTSNFATGGNNGLARLGSVVDQAALQSAPSGTPPMTAGQVKGLSDNTRSALDLEASGDATSTWGLIGSACNPPSSEAEEELAALMQVEANVASLGQGASKWTSAY